MSYEYDSKAEVMLLHTRDEHLIMRKREPRWKDLRGLDDAWASAIYTGQGRWAEIDDIDDADAEKIVEEWGHSKRMQDYFSLMQARHSVRQYTDQAIPESIRSQLGEYLKDLNRDSGLNMQLIYDEPECFGSARARYGSFAGCKNYISLVGDREIQDLEERCGFYGELLVLKAQELGLNTCWAALTHGRTRSAVAKNEKEVIVISLGYGKTQGTVRKSKSPEDVANVSDDSPDWFKKGIEAALLAPTAINQQKFRFTRDGDKVFLESGKLGPCLQIDLGIVRCHFELGAGRENFQWVYKK